MKKIIKILLSLLAIVIIVILYFSYITDNNNQEKEKLAKKITKNYNIEEKINYTNEYNNYYILKTDSKVIVLTNDYKEVKKEDLSKLKEISPDLEIIYKTNKFIYEKTIRNKKKITYEYFDALTGEQINKTVLELQ